MQVKQDFHFPRFSEKPNGISMILEPFWALFGESRRDIRTNLRRTDRPRQPPAHAGKISARGRGSRPPTPIIAME